MSTARLLGDYTDAVNKHGVESDEARGILAANAGDELFQERARTVRALRVTADAIGTKELIVLIAVHTCVQMMNKPSPDDEQLGRIKKLQAAILESPKLGGKTIDFDALAARVKVL